MLWGLARDNEAVITFASEENYTLADRLLTRFGCDAGINVLNGRLREPIVKAEATYDSC